MVNCIHSEEKVWSLEILKIVPKLFSSSTCMHVALLVSLRFVAVTKSTKYKNTIAFKHRHKLTVGIWLTSISLGFLPILSEYMDRHYLHTFTKYLILHGFHTFPVVFIILMYAMLSVAIKKKRNVRTEMDSPDVNDIPQFFERPLSNINKKTKSPTKMIKRVVTALVVCVLPYILCWQYGSVVIIKRCPFKAYDFEVRGNEHSSI